MKIAKLSLVAAMMLGSCAYAVDNVKVNGEAKLWYQTTEYGGDAATQGQKDAKFFHKGGDNAGSDDKPTRAANSIANTMLNVGVTMDLLPNLSMGASATALSTLGLDGNLVSGVPSNTQGVRDGKDGRAANGESATDEQWWMRELWLAYTMGKTTAKIGRQELNTPLAFTEKWNVVDNTFDAVVLMNQDIADTTLVGAFVGKTNSAQNGGTVTYDGRFNSFADHGAVAFGAINKSVPNTTLQAWYYDVTSLADAVWLQGDTKLIDGMLELGGQFAHMDPDNGNTANKNVGSGKSTNIAAGKVALNVVNSTFYAAYSQAFKGDNSTNFSNVATGDKSNIYTAMGSIYFDGEHTTRSDTKAWKIGASTKAVPGVTLSTSYAQAKQGDNDGRRTGAVAGVANSRHDFAAFDFIAATKVGPVDLTAIYTNYKIKYVDGKGALISNNPTNEDDKGKFDSIRFIASLKF